MLSGLFAWLTIITIFLFEIALLLGFLWGIYKAIFTDTYYFVASAQEAKLPEYQLAGNAQSKSDCEDALKYWKSVGFDQSQCLRISTVRHWVNIGKNFGRQWDLWKKKNNDS